MSQVSWDDITSKRHIWKWRKLSRGRKKHSYLATLLFCGFYLIVCFIKKKIDELSLWNNVQRSKVIGRTSEKHEKRGTPLKRRKLGRWWSVLFLFLIGQEDRMFALIAQLKSHDYCRALLTWQETLSTFRTNMWLPFLSQVRELAETLERSLSFGSSIKKPAGGVSLHFQGNGSERSQPQRTTAQQPSKQQVRRMRYCLSSQDYFALLTYF